MKQSDEQIRSVLAQAIKDNRLVVIQYLGLTRTIRPLVVGDRLLSAQVIEENERTRRFDIRFIQFAGLFRSEETIDVQQAEEDVDTEREHRRVRNQATLESFYQFAKAHPDLRFYQALCAWLNDGVKGDGLLVALTAQSPQNWPQGVFHDPWEWVARREDHWQ